MIKRVLYITVITLSLFGCKTSKESSDKNYLSYALDKNDYLPQEYFEKLKANSNKNIDSVLSNTSDFYKIIINSNPNKKAFELKERKFFTLEIINYGTKELYLPEWFKQKSLDGYPEIFIEIYKKKGRKFKKYTQSQINTHTFVQPKINQKRTVHESMKGKGVSYNLEIDTFHKIVDSGIYKAKVIIDLSNFGFFRKLTTEITFQVKHK